MNVERIRELADVIEKQPHVDIGDDAGFCMSEVLHNCGTPCCIAGWACAEKIEAGESIASHYVTAAVSLGLSLSKATSLFEPPFHLDWDSISPAHAAAVLRNLADTGEVDWSVGAPAEA